MLRTLLALIIAVGALAEVSAVAPRFAIALVADRIEGLGTNGGASGAEDTTGADLLIVVGSWYDGSTADVTISDSKSNNWSALTKQVNGLIDQSTRIWYSQGGTVGSGHTFTLSGSSTFPAIGIYAFSGVAASPFDVEVGGDGGTDVEAMNAGEMTPTQDGEVVISAMGWFSATSGAAVSGYTVQMVANTGGVNVGLGTAYQIQTTATATNPAWTWTGPAAPTFRNATFKAASGGGGGGGTVPAIINSPIRCCDLAPFFGGWR